MPLPALEYSECSTPIRVGDRVSVKRFLRRPLVGIVSHVHDRSLPIAPNGENDYGFTVTIDDDQFLWFGGVSPKVRLLSDDDS